MAELSFPDLKIDPTSPNEGILKLLSKVKPNWESSEIQIKMMSGGHSSQMFKCFVKSNPREAVTVRVSADRMPSTFINRDQEKKALGEAARLGYFTRVYADYQNGYCYEYINGHPLLGSGGTLAMDEVVIRLVARQMANIHTVRLPGADYSKCHYFDFIKNSISTKYTHWNKNLPKKDDMLTELSIVQEFCDGVGSPLVLCHGDTHPGNIVRVEGKDEVVFVDWEGTHIGHRAIDIAYFLYIYDMLEYTYKMPKEVPGEDERAQMFAKYYLQRQRELGGEPADKERGQIIREVKAYKLAVYYWWVFMVVMNSKMAHSLAAGRDVDGIIQFNVAKYLSAKRELIGNGEFGKKKETSEAPPESADESVGFATTEIR